MTFFMNATPFHQALDLSNEGDIIADSRPKNVRKTRQTFFALGLKHCVVNMFVIPAAMSLGAPISAADWWRWNQIPATLGNLTGGAFFTGYLAFLV